MPSRRSTVADERPQQYSIAWFEGRRRRTVLGARAVVARAEHDGGKLPDVIRRERAATGEPHFDRAAGRHVLTVEASGQGGSVVGDHEVAGPQEIDERGPRDMSDLPTRVNHEQFRLRRAVNGMVCGDHERVSVAGDAGMLSRSGSAAGSAAAIELASSWRQSPAA